MGKMREHQIAAVNVMYDFVKSDTRIAKIYMARGTGMTSVIVSAIREMKIRGDLDSVLLISTNRVICEQYVRQFESDTEKISVVRDTKAFKGNNVLVMTYQQLYKDVDSIDFNAFDLIVFESAQFLDEEKLRTVFSGDRKILGFFTGPGEGKVFGEVEYAFSYDINNAIEDGYSPVLTEHYFVEKFTNSLLEYCDYKKIEIEPRGFSRAGRRIRPDVVAEKGTKRFIFEIKYYRNKVVSYSDVKKALNQLKTYEFIMDDCKTKSVFVLVMPCVVSNEVKKVALEDYKIIVWDISNLLYLCGSNQELITMLARAVPFSIDDIKIQCPVESVVFSRDESELFEAEKEVSKVVKYQNMLKQCRPGQEDGSNREYEEICTEIIKYLFETDFLKMSEQHKTDDDLFRMDCLCSFKETKVFWKFLMQFYNSKFVVFEYKNYSSYIKQNLIYITEKYLFSAALRNVAIIISRHGFDTNACKAAMGCLKENGKLIIDLKDDDLLKMVAMKENGEEPSDYLLSHVEELLMSVSK